MTTTISHEQLRHLIGAIVRHNDGEYLIIEVLEDGPAVVLQDVCHRDGFQENQFGAPSRRVPETCTIPVLTADRTALHEAFRALELLDR